MTDTIKTEGTTEGSCVYRLFVDGSIASTYSLTVQDGLDSDWDGPGRFGGDTGLWSYHVAPSHLRDVKLKKLIGVTPIHCP